MRGFDKLFSEMLSVCKELTAADKGELWEHYNPEPAAEMSEIMQAQEKLNVRFSEEYIEFLKTANGWNCFYQLVDLFGTEDFISEESERMTYAKNLLNVNLEYIDSLQSIRDYLLPIAVSRTDMDLFVLMLAEGEEYGQVVWLAGGEIERFSSFNHFFEEMIEYNREELEDVINYNAE